MLRNYLITALRNLYRNRTNTLISTSGLALGITCSMVLFLMASYFKSYNTHEKNYDNIYRLVTEDDGQGGQRDYTPGVAPPTLDALRLDYPEFGQMLFVSNKYGTNLFEVEHDGQTKYIEHGSQGIGYTENAFFEIFTRDLLKGNLSEVLLQPNEIVLSEKLSQKFFGNEDPMGKVVTLDQDIQLKVVGVMKDYSNTSDFPFDAFISYITIKEKHLEAGWGSVNSDDQIYLLIEDKTQANTLEALLPDFVLKHHSEDNDNMTMHLQPMSDFHFNTKYSNFGYNAIDEIELIVMWIVGIFLVLSACINYVNLSTAVAIKRSKEIGIRKVLGGTRQQLIVQHLGETFFITLVSVLISLGLGELAIIKMNEFLGVHLYIDIFANTSLQVYLITILILVTLLAGFYPSLVLSKYSPVLALKNLITYKDSGKVSFRKSLVVFQFLISQLFIIGTVVIISQLDYIMNTDLGFRTESILEVPIPESSTSRKQTLMNELKRMPNVENVSLTYSTPTSGSTSATDISISDDPEDYVVEVKLADAQYTDVFGIEILAGKGLPESDTINGILVNKELAKISGHLEPEDILGKMITVWGSTVPVTGVVDDFHTHSLRSKKSPVVIFSRLNNYRLAAITFNTQNLISTTESIENTWKKVYPEYNYEQTFLDERIADFYKSEQDTAAILTTFSSIAIFIGCLGLFGLASFMVNQKVKEIGVRKVLGASVGQILMLFSKQFLILIGVAFCIAAPVGYFFMSKYLEFYEYRMELGPGIFIFALASTILIALITVGSKSYRAAIVNPATSLKDE